MVRAKDVGARENGVRMHVAQNYFLTCLRITLRRRYFLFGGSCWVGSIELKLATKV
jgi:hypothetical protein